ncbi:TonB-dependent receptor, partial [bacterium]|nr:TonB-dependent receptor [bacterium]
MKKFFLLITIFICMAVVASFAQEEIPEVAVTVEVEAEKEKPVKIETFTPEKAEEVVGAQNFADILKRLPGTQTIYGCAMNSPRLSFRGSTYTFLQMLVEGINLNPIGSCVLERVPWRSMAEINVIRGPVPVYYPGNTISGLVSMQMKTGDKYPGTGLAFTYGTYNTQYYDLVSGGGDEQRNYFIAFNRSHSDGWMPNSTLDLSDLSFKVVYGLDDTSKLTLAGVYLHGEKGGFKPLGPNIAGAVVKDPVTGKPVLVGYLYEHRWPNLQRPGFSLTYEKKVSDKTNMMFRVSPVAVTYDLQFKRWLFKNPQNPSDPNFKPKIEEMFTLMRYHLLRTELNYDINLAEDNILSWGLWWEGNWQRTTSAVPASSPTPGTWQKNDVKYEGVFLQQTKSLSDKSAMVWGMRYDKSDPGGGAFVPFIDYHFKTTPTSDLRFSFTRNKRFPQLSELYGTGPNIGNPSLKPPIANIFQLDWENKVRENGKFTTTLFYSKEKDRIATDQNYVYQNIGKAREKGVELSYEYTAGNTSFWSNYTYLDAWDITNDMPLIPAYRTAPPKHMFKAGATVKAKKDWTYDFEVYYWGERKTDVKQPTQAIWFNGTDPTPVSVTIPTSVPSAWIFNIKITKSLPEGRALSLAIQNL